MNYWMICLPREDMEHCINIGTFGARVRGVLRKARKGDKILCYISKECKIIAAGELISDYYMSDDKIFRADGDFPDRFDFKSEKFKSQNELDIRSVINDLLFVTNKAYWSVFFRLSNRVINKHDYEMILAKVKAKA